MGWRLYAQLWQVVALMRLAYTKPNNFFHLTPEMSRTHPCVSSRARLKKSVRVDYLVSMEQIFQLGSVGLVYDVLGVTIFGIAFFTKSLDALIVESGTYYGGNNAALESLIQSQTDGVTGTIILFVGFLLQFLGSVGLHCELAGKILAVILVVMCVSYFGFLRKRMVGYRFQKAKQLRQQQEQESKQ